MQTFALRDSNNVPLDAKLDHFIRKNNGFFIELGANDGITQSNTAFFEFYRKWTGILIEPSFVKYKKCIENRPNSVVENFACVSDEYSSSTIMGDFDGSLMASVNGSRLKTDKMVVVPTITLEKLLDKHIFPNQIIDLLSLDTEGYELPILKGLNLKKYRPRFMLIEIYEKDFSEIVFFLSENKYTLHSNFSNYNYRTNPYWDGTHNDYLFIDTTM